MACTNQKRQFPLRGVWDKPEVSLHLWGSQQTLQEQISVFVFG